MRAMDNCTENKNFFIWKPSKLIIFLLATAIIFGSGLSLVFLVRQTDNRMRQSLLDKAQTISLAVDSKEVKALRGSQEDLNSDTYRQLKKQLISIREVNPSYRFIYLMGQKADGRVFFYVDSEPPGSADESPPGQIYQEISKDYLTVFKKKTALVAGPVADRWGQWLSALVPLMDSGSGELIAVLGMDIDAGSWRRNLIAEATLPASLVLVVMAGFLSLLFSFGGSTTRPRPVLKQLLPVLFILVSLLIFTAYWLLFLAYSDRIEDISRRAQQQVMGDVRQLLAEQGRGLAAVQIPLIQNEELIRALKEKDQQSLLELSQPLFRELNSQYNVTHFYFSDINRICLLRVHKPEKYGDRFDRFTALEAERSGKVASGIELGPLGTFTLRVVRPVFEKSQLLGYLELGKEIEDVFDAIVEFEGVNKVLLINKKELARPVWESGMALLGREADWERFSDRVIIYSSFLIPKNIEDYIGCGQDKCNIPREVVFDGRYWRLMPEAVIDVSGQEVGKLFFFYDITELKVAYRKNMVIGGSIALALLVGILAIIFIALYRTDSSIRVQEAKLIQSEQNLSATLSSIGDGVISCDSTGRVVSLNRAAERLTGWESSEAAGRPIEEIFPVVNVKTGEIIEVPVRKAIAENRVINLANNALLISRNGDEYQVADSCAPIRDNSGALIGAVLVFRDVSQEYRQRKELEESELRFKALFEKSPVSIIVHDKESGEVIDANETAFKAYGFATLEQFKKSNFWQEEPPYSAKDALKLVHKASAEGMQQFEWKSRKVNGEVFWEYVTLMPVVIDGRERILATTLNVTSVKEAEEALGESEKKLNMFFSQSLDGFFFMMLDEPIAWNDTADKEALLDYAMKHQRMTEVNQALLDQYGAKKAELIGLTPVDLFRHDLKHGRNIWRGLFDRGRWHVETREQRLDGTPIIIEGDYTCLYDDQGRITGHFGVQTDITQRKQAEEELKSAYKKYQSLVSNIPGIAYRCKFDDNWTMLFMSDAVDPLSGYPASDFINSKVRTYASVIYPADADFVTQSIKMAVAQKHPWDIEYRICRKDGTICWVHEKGRGIYNDDGSLLYLDGLILDISKRKAVEESIFAAAEERRILLDNIQTQVWYLTNDHTYGLVNKAHADFYNRLPKELAFKNFYDIFTKEIAESRRQANKKVFNSGKPVQTEEWVTNAFGDRRLISVFKTPKLNENEVVEYVVCSAEDITEQKRAQEETAKAIATKEAFLSMVSHELRTPLAVIMEGIKIVTDGSCGPINDEQKEYLATAERNVDRLGRLINDVLDLQKIDAGMTRFNVEKGDINKLVREIQQAMAPVAEKKGLKFEVSFCQDILEIEFDSDKITQVLTNLTNNAIKFSEKGSILISVEKGNNYVKVSVKDNGFGIKPEDLPRLFGRFEQISAGNQRKPGGTGLGLAICKEIIENHKGRIWVESEAGKGSVFSFILPIKERRRRNG